MRRAEPVIEEILQAINGILLATDHKTFDDFQGDWLLQRGVERALEIISEASRHLPDEILETAPEIPWKQIRAIGNILRHQYHAVAEDIVWAVVVEHIGPLKTAAEEMRERLALSRER
jgi:uncharacterized protein with HEPN domain